MLIRMVVIDPTRGVMTDEEACRVWATALRTLTYDPAGTVLRLIQRWVNR